MKTCHVCVLSREVWWRRLCGGIGRHVICVRGFAQQETEWGMCILLAGIGVRSLVHALQWVGWFYLVANSICALRVIALTVYCLGKKRAHKVCILIILMCLC